MKLAERLAERGQVLAERESAESERFERARCVLSELHEIVTAAVESFHAACRAGGADHLLIEVSPPRRDDKYFHSVQFDLSRGVHEAIVTIKSRGEVTLVGPFRKGKAQGPCNRFSMDARPDIEVGLAQLLEEFIDQAFSA